MSSKDISADLFNLVFASAFCFDLSLAEGILYHWLSCMMLTSHKLPTKVKVRCLGF